MIRYEKLYNALYDSRQRIAILYRIDDYHVPADLYIYIQLGQKDMQRIMLCIPFNTIQYPRLGNGFCFLTSYASGLIITSRLVLFNIHILQMGKSVEYRTYCLVCEQEISL